MKYVLYNEMIKVAIKWGLLLSYRTIEWGLQLNLLNNIVLCTIMTCLSLQWLDACKFWNIVFFFVILAPKMLPIQALQWPALN